VGGKKLNAVPIEGVTATANLTAKATIAVAEKPTTAAATGIHGPVGASGDRLEMATAITAIGTARTTGAAVT
jgi:hypothetical protein